MNKGPKSERGIDTFTLRNSSRNAFLHCPYYYYLRYIEGIESPNKSVPLTIGTAVHDGLQALYDSIQAHDMLSSDHWTPVYNTLRLWASTAKADVEKRYYEEGSFMTQADLEQSQIIIDESYTLADELMRNYYTYWLTNDLEEYQIISTEQKLYAPIYTNRGGVAHCRLEGTIDMIVRRRDDGSVWIMEHKTAGSDLDAIVEHYRRQPQHVGYMHLMRHNIDKYPAIAGHNPVGIVYNIIRKKIPREPTPLKCKKCKGKGCELCDNTGIAGMSKAKIDTTPAVYLDSIQKYPHLDPKEYTEMLISLEPKRYSYFKREYVYVTEDQSKGWMNDTYNISRMIRRCYELGKEKGFPKAVSQCNSYGRLCSLFRVCNGELNRETAAKII